MWTAIAHLVNSPTSALRHIAAAIGYQHLCIDQGQRPTQEIELRLTVHAIRALRDVIEAANTSSSGEFPTETLFSAVFLTMLESLQGSFSQTLVHLEHGIRVGLEQQARKKLTPETRHCLRYLEDHARSIIIREPESAAALKGRELMQASLERMGPSPRPPFLYENADDSTLLGAVHWIQTDVVVFATQYHLSAIANKTLPESQRPQFLAARDSIRARSADLIRQLDDAFALAARENDKSLMTVYDLAKARLIKCDLVLNKPMDYKQTDYDTDIPVFEALLDLTDSALDRQFGGEASSSTEVSQRPPAFALGQGAHHNIVSVAINCRHPHLRERAMKLFDKCPMIDGPWTTQYARANCQAIMDWEDARATRYNGFRPRTAAEYPLQSRVYFHYPFVMTDEQTGATTPALRIFVRSEDGGDQVISDVLPIAHLMKDAPV